MCITYPDHIATYMTGENVVVPAGWNLFADEKIRSGWKRAFRLTDPHQEEHSCLNSWKSASIEGAYYAVPYMRSTEACYINKTYVEALGYTLPETLTWDFIWEVSEAATEKNADGTYKLNGGDVMIPFIYKSTDNMMIQMLQQQGAGYSTETGDIQSFQ